MNKWTLIIFQLLTMQAYAYNVFEIKCEFDYEKNKEYCVQSSSSVNSYRDSEQDRVGNYYAPNDSSSTAIGNAINDTNRQFNDIFEGLGNGQINSDNLSDIITQVGANYSPEQQQLFIDNILGKSANLKDTSVIPVTPYLADIRPVILDPERSQIFNNARLKTSGAIAEALKNCEGQGCSRTSLQVSQNALNGLINTALNNSLNADYLERWGEDTSFINESQDEFRELIDNLEGKDLNDVIKALEKQEAIQKELNNIANEWDIPLDTVELERAKTPLEDYASELIAYKRCLQSGADCLLPNFQTNNAEYKNEYQQLESIYKTTKYVRESNIEVHYKETASDYLNLSSDALISGDIDSSKQLEEVATSIVDIGLGLIPVVSIGKDVYELFTGKNLVTKEELSTFERGLAAVGILTAGGSHYIQAAGKILTKTARVSEKIIDVGEKVIVSARKLGLMTSEGIKDFADLSKRIIGNDIGAVGDLSKVIKGKMTRFHPMKHGVLHDTKLPNGTIVADTFRSSSYFETVLDEPVKLYRVYGEGASPLSQFWSRTKPTGPGQAVFDSALDPAWGNTAQKWIEITVPENTMLYEGVVSEIALIRGTQQIPVGKLLGGGSQVFINNDRIPAKWISGKGEF
ncbi:pre-toxin TG domain-containing protein [Bacteriovorax sp. Seq25_V]|uniref:pre-toxin TG domain-containing protein n=1 Tax=Bacteriovorax sp. Seq25_V TaxID=1201288 RepID=UPI00038A4B8B|nr:pre-toxin TG domain-containing protein [Bacteriovorax sp. Seq25_V]EQC47357.1 hypothetical protein M900_0854 [Bacteriovorax sp. Seq25_V]